MNRKLLKERRIKEYIKTHKKLSIKKGVNDIEIIRASKILKVKPKYIVQYLKKIIPPLS